MKRHALIFACLFGVLPSISPAAGEVDMYANQLQSAADNCKGSCASTCALEAKKVGGMTSVAADGTKIKEAIMRCYSSIVMNPADHQNPMMMALIMSSAQIPAGGGAAMPTPAARPSVTKPNFSQYLPKNESKPFTVVEVDTNFRNSDGSFNMDKVITMFETIPSYCDSLHPSSRQTCQRACSEAVQEVKTAVNQIEANGKGMVNPEMLVKNELLGHVGCLATIGVMHQGKMKGVPAYLALLESGKAVDAGEWPPKQKLSLDLELSEEVPRLKADDDFIRDLLSKDAPAKLNFSDAQAKLKAVEDFPRLANEAKAAGHSLDDLRGAMGRLNEKRSQVDGQKWQDKAYQISDAGMQKALYDAATRPCDRSYLKDFRVIPNWHSRPVNQSYGDYRPPLHHRVKPVYLQRLCFTQLFETIKTDLKPAANSQELQRLAGQYLSEPPAMSRISRNQWLPVWQDYQVSRKEDLRGGDLAQAEKNAERNRNDRIKKQEAAEREAWSKKRPKAEEAYRKALAAKGSNSVLNPASAAFADALAFYRESAKSARYLLSRADKDVLLVSSHNIDSSSSNQNGLLAATIVSRPGDQPQFSYSLMALVSCEQVPVLMDQWAQNPQGVNGEILMALNRATGTCLNFPQKDIRGVLAGQFQFSRDQRYFMRTTLTDASFEQVSKTLESGEAIMAALQPSLQSIGYGKVELRQFHHARQLSGRLKEALGHSASDIFFLPQADQQYASIVGVPYAQSATQGEKAIAKSDARKTAAVEAERKAKADKKAEEQAQRVAILKQIDVNAKANGLPGQPYRFDKAEFQQMEKYIGKNGGGSCPFISHYKQSKSRASKVSHLQLCSGFVKDSRLFADFISLYNSELRKSGKGSEPF